MGKHARNGSANGWMFVWLDDWMAGLLADWLVNRWAAKEQRAPALCYAFHPVTSFDIRHSYEALFYKTCQLD